ncbi:MAG: DUF5060 domain-containing protein [Pirellulaceae bacterium]
MHHISLLRQVCQAAFAASAFLSSSILAQSKDVVFKEVDGLVAVEAEHFSEQTKTETRKFYLTANGQTPDVAPDGDPNHVAGASGGAYLEVLPDTRRTHGDKLIKGTNFAPDPGKMAVLHYRVHFQTMGRYYVWVRAFSTGSEDNGLHVGIDGKWPASGQRLQWCSGKQQWWWESKQRTEAEHCGETHKIYLDIDRPGEHIIAFSMREDGFEFDKWLMTTNREFERPRDAGPAFQVHAGPQPATHPMVAVQSENTTLATQGVPTKAPALAQPRKSDGDGSVAISGELKQWHKVTLTMDGPFAHEQDNAPNPFTDLRMQVEFKHSSGKSYTVPGYFAADGDAAESSAASGTKWRAHFAADLAGEWTYRVGFHRGQLCALDPAVNGTAVKPFDDQQGAFNIAAAQHRGRLEYVGKHFLRFAGSGEYFLKAGADAPETLLGYADFDGTVANKPGKVPLKTYTPHLRDWTEQDPSWQGGKGKGLIGAINYLSSKGCNAFSFLTYNAGGDGDNVWPFTQRDDKLHYDCSKLDQWSIVFDHGTARGMYLHFKLQETENDDNRSGTNGNTSKPVPTSLDDGRLGAERKLYCRELIARFAHNLALNWNLGEENTQSTQEQRDMIDYIAALDAYDHPIVVHTYPEQQEQVYGPLLGDKSQLTGVSLQNSGIHDTHRDTLHWVKASAAAGKPWVVAFDESGTAAHGQCPDLGYRGYDGHDKTGKMTYTEHEVRQQTLWGTLMAGGAGVEYYFGYQYAENDLDCEDWRSRDRSWDYCRVALEFFRDQRIPFSEMSNHNELIGNPENTNKKYCLATPADMEAGAVYVVYLAQGGTTDLDLSAADGKFGVQWFNPRSGGNPTVGTVAEVSGGGVVQLGTPPADAEQDWVVIVRANG